MNIQEHIASVAHMEDLRVKVKVDKYKYVCAAEGIKERKAMDMYMHFQIFAQGRIPYVEHQKATEEYIQQIVEMAERAKAEYDHDRYLSANLTNFDYNHWGDDFKYALYIFIKKGEPIKVEEFDISKPDTYITVALLIKGGWELDHIIRQCDQTSSTQRYLNFTDEERRNTKTLRIYDGDVFEVVPGDSIISNSRDCGMYLCHHGAYRKLIYIPGKGYVNNGKPLIDGDTLEINIDNEGLFNSHKITWDAFRKVGNIHIDMGCLIEIK